MFSQVRSASGLAAGDVDRGSCDVAGSVGYQISDQFADFVELSVTAHGDDLGVIGGELLRLYAAGVSKCLVVSRCAKAGCFHDSGSDCDDADVVLAKFLSPAACEAVASALGCGVS